MAYALLILGGLINLYRFYSRVAHLSEEDMPHKNQGYATAFVTGLIFFGLPMLGIYWLLT